MGYAISFIAVKGVGLDGVVKALGATSIDRVVDPIFGAPLAWGESPQGWLILASNDWSFTSPARLELLSTGGEALGCNVEDHVMASDAWGYRDGVQVWSIERDCEVDGDDVRTSGELPAVFTGILAAAKREQADGEGDVDFIFDVPADVCAAICGYRYDQDQEYPFTELRLPEVEMIRPVVSDPGKGFWGPLVRRLFGLR